ncbi:hypothetical protein [Actinocatenispora rupis]|uniref:Uncharacterized protein n=1 Tax=Actinocatenispora rupis TaxID=519421 RepID=A0A8J3J4L8_9ACTN|nr:hypothetical protein [Actinocatenispora rupis]GID10047.1 hypothetical protein Aru02nite_09360 [Actinocatenispora rupis]
MPDRDFANPRSMAGLSADEILAMKPAGWLVRPFGAGRAGFRMISPGPMPGAYGSVCHHPATPGFQVFAERPEPDLFVLNRALEHPQLVDLLVRWCRDDEQPQPTVPVLSAAVESLLARRLVDVYEDDLHSPTLLLLGQPDARRAVREPLNWWRAADGTDGSAESVYLVATTARGRRALGIESPVRPRRRRFVPRPFHH